MALGRKNLVASGKDRKKQGDPLDHLLNDNQPLEEIEGDHIEKDEEEEREGDETVGPEPTVLSPSSKARV